MSLPLDFEDRLRRIYEQEDHTLDAYKLEKPVLIEAIEKIGENENLALRYEVIEPIGRGGAAVVIKVREKQLGAFRALKVPRPKDQTLIDSVRNEIDHLMKLTHDHIIRLHMIGEVDLSTFPLPYPYFVMDYIPNGTNLRKDIENRLAEVKHTRDLRTVTAYLLDRFTELADALAYLRANDVIHFDVKPSNILIDERGKVRLSDLGFAKKKTSDQAKTIVGFTIFYAHPDLRSEYMYMSTRNRVLKPIAPAEFSYVWDVYALGKTLLELLSLVDRSFPDTVMYEYDFLHLHLMACRMLDGRNLATEETDRIRQQQLQEGVPLCIYRETWLNLLSSDFKDIAYSDSREVYDDLRKMARDQRLEKRIAELDPFYPKVIQLSPGPPAPFTPRVKAIIEHPCFVRLTAVPQLGLASKIYPTVTHQRFEHSLGAFRNCCAYVRAIYHDPYNPLFRQLASDEDLRCVLVASLLHDIGHYPLAHELGEIDSAMKHESMSVRWLDNPEKDNPEKDNPEKDNPEKDNPEKDNPEKDNQGRTLRDILEDDTSGWGVTLDMVKAILSGPEAQSGLWDPKNLKVRMLASIIDGPIDVDKLDFLMRDSHEAFLPYGALIDLDRLVKNLTVVISKDDAGKTIMTLGTYEKGQSAAESIIFARYLLYEALYWHHTARSIRAMLREVLRHPSQAARNHGRSKAQSSLCSDIDNLIGISNSPRQVGVTDVLNLLWKRSDETGKELIDLIRARKFYKRVLTIHDYAEPGEGPSLLDRFRTAQTRADFNGRVQQKILKALENYFSQVSGPLPSTVARIPQDKALQLLKKPGQILCDCPVPPKGSREKLRFIPEPQRLLQNYLSRADVGERVSEVWQKVFYRLMTIASKGRLYCHPDLRDLLMASLGPVVMRKALESSIEECQS